MKKFAIAFSAVLLLCLAAPAANAQWHHHGGFGRGFGYGLGYGLGYGYGYGYGPYYGYGNPYWGYPGYGYGNCRIVRFFRHGRVHFRRYCY